MKTLDDLVAEAQASIREIMPWDLEEQLQTDGDLLLLIDVREPEEYQAMHIEGSINVPRGVLESACEYDYDDTVPELVNARNRPVVVVCRSGKRSALAAYTMQQLGFKQIASLKSGLRGWNDYDQPMITLEGESVDGDIAEEYLRPNVRPDQKKPNHPG